MDSSNAQHVLKSNAVTEIYTPKDEGEVAGWIDCLCDDPSDCHCKTAGPHYGSQSPEYVKSLGYDLQLQGSSRRPRDLMSLRGLEIYSAQAAITRDRNRHWPEPTPFFREYLRHFEHDPVEWKSPKYQAYREKQIQLIEKKKPNPWPANIEYHFQRGRPPAPILLRWASETLISCENSTSAFRWMWSGQGRPRRQTLRMQRVDGMVYLRRDRRGVAPEESFKPHTSLEAKAL